MQKRGAPTGLAGFRPAFLALGRVLGIGFGSVSASPLLNTGQGHGHGGQSGQDGLNGLNGGRHSDGHHGGDTPLWMLALGSIVLVLLGGAFAGLTIALMGQDSIYLQVISGDHTEPQHKNAKSVLQLLNKGKHWVLVTLLLANVIVNESLPVVLDRFLGGGVAAIVGSTILIVIFGEIVPQSVCVRYGLPIGGYMAKPVLALMYLLGPVAWPTAKLLDYVLGEDHGTIYKKSGLKTLVTLHRTLGEASERLNQDEVTIITAVLDLKDKPVSEVMTPMEDVYSLAEDHILDEETMDTILSSGYSRIPVYRAGHRTDFVGMLLVKTLITYDPEDRIPVRDVQLGAIVETRPETSCLDIINFFQEGKSHMVLVSDAPGSDHGVLGVVTLEDVIEELIGEEIVDESDVYVDVHKAIRRLTPAPRARRLYTEAQSPQARAGGIAIKKIIDGAHSHPPSPLLEGAHPHPVGSHTSDAGPGQGYHDGSRPVKTAVFMRRQNSTGIVGIDGKLAPGGTVPIRSSLGEMKQQLRLGPANRANNPLSSTRGSIFKIKQGLGGGGEGDKPRNSSESMRDERSETTPLLNNKNV